MNLRGIANGITRAVNPDVGALLMRSTGSVTATDGSRTPTYRKIPFVTQVQALSASDLQHLDGLNIQGVRRAIYADTQIAAVIRVRNKGGDLIVFPKGTLPEGTTWLAAYVLERWTDWCKIAITLQDDELDAEAC